jgi:hypothetical protein
MLPVRAVHHGVADHEWQRDGGQGDGKRADDLAGARSRDVPQVPYTEIVTNRRREVMNPIRFVRQFSLVD